MKIIDQHGNPLDAGLLREPQTARVATLAHFMVESQLDGLTPAKAARILRQADQGDILAQHQLFVALVSSALSKNDVAGFEEKFPRLNIARATQRRMRNESGSRCSSPT